MFCIVCGKVCVCTHKIAGGVRATATVYTITHEQVFEYSAVKIYQEDASRVWTVPVSVPSSNGGVKSDHRLPIWHEPCSFIFSLSLALALALFLSPLPFLLSPASLALFLERTTPHCHSPCLPLSLFCLSLSRTFSRSCAPSLSLPLLRSLSLLVLQARLGPVHTNMIPIRKWKDLPFHFRAVAETHSPRCI